jgi:hypothetical protein
MKLPFREAPPCLPRPDGVGGELHYMKKGIVWQRYEVPVSVTRVGLTPVLGRCFKVTDNFCSADIFVPLATKREWWSLERSSAFLMYISNRNRHYPESLRAAIEVLDKAREKVITNLTQSVGKGEVSTV